MTTRAVLVLDHLPVLNLLMLTFAASFNSSCSKAPGKEITIAISSALRRACTFRESLVASKDGVPLKKMS